MMSARYGETDGDDILFLFNKLNIDTTERAMDILFAYFTEAQILPKTQYIIEETINRIHSYK